MSFGLRFYTFVFCVAVIAAGQDWEDDNNLRRLRRIEDTLFNGDLCLASQCTEKQGYELFQCFLNHCSVSDGEDSEAWPAKQPLATNCMDRECSGLQGVAVYLCQRLRCSAEVPSSDEFNSAEEPYRLLPGEGATKRGAVKPSEKNSLQQCLDNCRNQSHMTYSQCVTSVCLSSRLATGHEAGAPVVNKRWLDPIRCPQTCMSFRSNKEQYLCCAKSG